MIAKKTGATSMAFYITSTLQQGNVSQYDWEQMQQSLSTWIETELQSEDKRIAYLEKEEATAKTPAKIYRSKIKRQNLVAVNQFVAALYYALFNQKRKTEAMMLHLKHADKRANEARRWALCFQSTMKDMAVENQLLSDQCVMLLEQVTNLSQQAYEARLMEALTKDESFKKKVEVLVANGITEL